MKNHSPLNEVKKGPTKTETPCCQPTTNKKDDPCCKQPTDGSSCCNKTLPKEENSKTHGCC